VSARGRSGNRQGAGGRCDRHSGLQRQEAETITIAATEAGSC
jgi:hypothetical protein